MSNKPVITQPEKASISQDAIQSVEIIAARGNIWVRLTAMIIAGVIALALLIGGLWAYFSNPSQAKDLWLIIGPIISGVVSGLVGYQIGQSSSKDV